MGKGNRNSRQRASAMAENPEIYLDKKKTQGQKSGKDKAIAIVCIVLAAVIVAILICSALGEFGVFSRMTKAVTTDNVKVDNAMMAYFLNDTIMSWYSNYGGYSSLFSVDLSSDLRTQQYGQSGYYETMFLGSFTNDVDGNGIVSWYDYFLASTLDEVKMIVIYAEAAKAKGITLSDEDKAEIDTFMDEIKASLKTAGSSFGNQYGRGVSAGDVRRCQELIHLAMAFSEVYQSELEAELEKDDKSLYDYVSDNKDEFYSAKCLKYVLTVDQSKYGDEQKYDSAVNAAKEYLEKLSKADSYDSFIGMIKDYQAGEQATETTSGADEDVISSETKTEETAKLPDGMVETDINYSTETDEINEWLFGDTWASEGEINYVTETKEVTDTEAKTETETENEKETEVDKKSSDETDVDTDDGETRSENEKASADTDSTKKTHEVFTATVYYVLKSCDVDHEYTHNFGYLLVEDKSIAEEVRTEFLAKDSKTLQGFYDLIESKHNNLHGTESHSHEDVFEFDQLEKQTAGFFNTTYYSAMNTWLEDASRQAGDVSDIIEIKADDETYYAVIFFEKENTDAKSETWYVNAFDSTVSSQFESWYDGQLSSGIVTVNSSAVSDIDTIKFYNSSSSN